MKHIAIVALAVTCIAVASCGGGSPSEPAPGSRLQVYVHWGDVGLADRRLEVLEVGAEKLTDATGIAEFSLPAGSYSLRAYEINRGGPPLAHVDFPVTTTRGKTTRVEIVDCLPCVAPSMGD